MEQMTIGDVAARTGLRASAIRYYEATGLLPVAARQSGKRVYDASILVRIAVIELAKAAGFTLPEMREVLSAGRQSQPATAWKKFAHAKGAEIDRELHRLGLMRRIVSQLGECTCGSLDDCGRAFAEALARSPRRDRQFARMLTP